MLKTAATVFFCVGLSAQHVSSAQHISSKQEVIYKQEVQNKQNVLVIDTVLQRFHYFSKYLSPEKLYLHTDKLSYFAGEKIWFKGYLVNKSLFSQLPESNFIYVELLYGKDGQSDKNLADTVLVRVKVKRTEDGLAGYLTIPKEVAPGNFTLRAYSNWMLNNGEEYMFNSRIGIIEHKDESMAESKKDEEMDDNGKIITHFGYAEPTEDFDVQFFPESGRYLTDNMAVIAFKAVDSQGRGIFVNGDVYNQRDSLITSFTTEHFGMGEMMFYPLFGNSYYAVVKTSDGEKKKFDLPLTCDTGAVVNLKRYNGSINLQVTLSKDILANPVFLLVHNGSEIFYYKQVIGQSQLVRMSEKDLLAGINHAIVVTSVGEILAERLFFVGPWKNYKADIKADKEKYGKRELVKFTINLHELNDNLELNDTLDKSMTGGVTERGVTERGVTGDFSVSVTDCQLITPVSNTDDIISYMLLSSELKGKIENPQYYFDEGIPLKDRTRALDLLMMVQGWRYYDMAGIFLSKYPKVTFGKEYNQSISGVVSGLFSKNVRSRELTVFAPSIDLIIKSAFDNSHKFVISEMDFPDSTSFFIQCKGKDDQSMFSRLEIDAEKFAKPYKYSFIPAPINDLSISSKDNPVSFSPDGKSFYPFLDTVFKEYAKLMRQQLYGKWNKDAITLKEVVVTADALYRPYRNPSPYGQAFEKNQVREREQLSIHDNMPVIDYLISTYNGLTFALDEDGNKQLISTRQSSVTYVTRPLLFIDGMKIDMEIQKTIMEGFSISDVENIVFLRGNEGALYNTTAGVILISMRNPDMTKEKKSPQANIENLIPLGWQKPLKFYSPKYEASEIDKSSAENISAGQNLPECDLRATVYWNPSVKTNNKGVAEFSFYTSDSPASNYLITIEGVTSDGESVAAVFSNRL